MFSVSINQISIYFEDLSVSLSLSLSLPLSQSFSIPAFLPPSTNACTLQIFLSVCVLTQSCQLFTTPWTVAHQALLRDFSCKNTGVGCHFLLQGIFLNQGSNPSPPHLLYLLHWQAYSLPLSHLWSPWISGPQISLSTYNTPEKFPFPQSKHIYRFIYLLWSRFWGFPDSSIGKESACNVGDPGWIPGSGRSAGEGISYTLQYSWASLMAQLVKNLPAMRETWVQSLGWDDPLKKRKAAHCSILAWRIPWTLQSMGSQRVRHIWVTFPFALMGLGELFCEN